MQARAWSMAGCLSSVTVNAARAVVHVAALARRRTLAAAAAVSSRKGGRRRQYGERRH